MNFLERREKKTILNNHSQIYMRSKNSMKIPQAQIEAIFGGSIAFQPTDFYWKKKNEKSRNTQMKCSSH